MKQEQQNLLLGTTSAESRVCLRWNYRNWTNIKRKYVLS